MFIEFDYEGNCIKGLGNFLVEIELYLNMYKLILLVNYVLYIYLVVVIVLLCVIKGYIINLYGYEM